MHHPGCGASFSVWLSEIIPRHRVTAPVLNTFLWAWRESGGHVLAAWEKARTGFSTESAYRWIRRLRLNQSQIRSWLCRLRAPPSTVKEGNTMGDLFVHLEATLGMVSTIKTFQERFQEAWPMAAPPNSHHQE